MSDVREDPLYRRALECTRTELSIKRESLCLCAMRCWALRLFPFQLACFRPVVVVVVCARAERRAWVALLDAERFADVLLFLMCVAGVRQTTTPSSRRVQWCLPRHWRAVGRFLLVQLYAFHVALPQSPTFLDHSWLTSHLARTEPSETFDSLHSTHGSHAQSASASFQRSLAVPLADQNRPSPSQQLILTASPTATRPWRNHCPQSIAAAGACAGASSSTSHDWPTRC